MSKYTISYGVLPRGITSVTEHLLPISTITNLESSVITTGRDGNVIIHRTKSKLTVHSDWISDIACISQNQFITVSHDFTICYNWYNLGWNHKIIGYHNDYVKGISLLDLGDTSCKFITVGLDKRLKLWSLDLVEVEKDEDIEANLICEFDNTSNLDTGSIYCVSCAGQFAIFGDNDGSLVWYDPEGHQLVRRIENAHSANLKTIRPMDGNKTILSTSADGTMKLWNVSSGFCLMEKKFENAIWTIEGSNSTNFYVGDSAGRIFHIINGQSTCLFDGKENEQGGILAMVNVDNMLWFSLSGNSNLNKLNLETKELKTTEGGRALLRCSLLTNRRHVITENTRGAIEKWDIISCELLETFHQSEGTFDEIVRKVNPKEVLPHWCSVSIKTGLLFVKLNQRLVSTEVYGGAIKDYELLNYDKADELDLDERYNLGTIVINSLLNGLVEYELAKDKTFREEFVHSKRPTPPTTPIMLRRNNSIPTEMIGLEQKDNKPGKEKRRLSILTKFGGSGSSTPQNSAPGTPNGLFDASQGQTGIIEEKEDELEMLLPGPAAAPSASLRPVLLTKTSTDPALERSATPSSAFGLPKWSRSRMDSNGDDRQGLNNAVTTPIKFNFSSKSFSNNATSSSENEGQFLNQYIEEIQQSYLKQTPSSSSSFMKFGKKVPETLFVKDSTRPIVRIKSGFILTVNCWKEGSFGETIAFSTLLSQPTYSKDDIVMNAPVYESLERHMPFWLGKLLFKEDKVIRSYPKITFIIQPWKDEVFVEEEVNVTAETKKSGIYKQPSKPPESPLMLPKINDSNVRLTAPNMIKAKKIKHFIVERFESKTSEMKSKIDAHEWLDILCRGNVLDNDITLSAIRTLYWKSNTDVVLEYRRKPIE